MEESIRKGWSSSFDKNKVLNLFRLIFVQGNHAGRVIRYMSSLDYVLLYHKGNFIVIVNC